MKKINSASEALEVFNAKFAGLIGEVKGEFKKRFIQTPGREYLAYVLPDDKRETMYIVPFHTEEKPCIEKYENVKIVQEIRSADEAVKAFVFEFGSLARAINPAAPAFDGYRFKKHLIKIREGNTFSDFIAHNSDKKYMFVVPVDGSTPRIETYSEITIAE